MRAHIQMIFQDPYGSLDPRMRVERMSPSRSPRWRASRAERRARVAGQLQSGRPPARGRRKISARVLGRPATADRHRARLITRPKLVVADEPVPALDVSVQAQALNLMTDLQREAGVTFLLISHDLAVVAHICTTTAVMYRGRIVETGPTANLFAAPAHPYTRDSSTRRRASTAPRPTPHRLRTPAVPARHGGCPTRRAASTAEARCLAETPALADVAGGRRAAC